MNSLEVAQWIEAHVNDGYTIHVSKDRTGYEVRAYPDGDAYPRIYACEHKTFIAAFDDAEAQFVQLNKV